MHTCRVRHEILASASNMHITASRSHTLLMRLTRVMTSHEVLIGYELVPNWHLATHPDVSGVKEREKQVYNKINTASCQKGKKMYDESITKNPKKGTDLVCV